MKNVISVLIVAIWVSFSTSCRWKTTKTAMKHGERLESSLTSFEKNRVKLSSKVISSLKNASEDLAVENPDIPEVSKDFEKDWRSIMSRYNKLKKDFVEVGKNSENYFGQLDELSSSINNEELRKKELGKNEALRAKWEVTYKKADVSIGKIDELLKSGNDFHMVLVASSIRQKLEENVEELEAMAEQATALLSELEVFTNAGKRLVSGG